MSFPSLATGDAVELKWRTDDIAPSYFGDYFGHVHAFGWELDVPTGSEEFVTILDPEREYFFQSVNGAPEAEVSRDESGCEVRVFRMRDIAPVKSEPWMPEYGETHPVVRVTTYRDWNHYSEWWWNLIKGQLEVTPAIRAKVSELCTGLETEEEKIAAIYDFVANEVHYRAWEFGVHGYQPYNTSAIFERRHGDCKDKSFLLNAMLGEIGVEAHPVLIEANRRRTRDDLTLPVLYHFNHCISYLPATDVREARFLDGVADWHEADTLPGMDRGARVLCVLEGVGELRGHSMGRGSAECGSPARVSPSSRRPARPRSTSH